MTGTIPIHDTARHLAEWERRKAAFLDFVAEFEDGRRVTVGVDKLDPVRGICLARFCHPDGLRRKVLPSIIRARFEIDKLRVWLRLGMRNSFAVQTPAVEALIA